MNFETLEIYCFECEIELLDENLTRRFGSKKRPLIDFKEAVMLMFKEYASKVENITVLDSNQSMANCGVNMLISSSLANTFSAALYALWSIEFIRTVLTSVDSDSEETLRVGIRKSAQVRVSTHLHVT